MSKKKKLIIALVTMLAIVFFILGFILLHPDNQKIHNESMLNNETYFKGEFVRAEILDNWEIEEISDRDNNPMLAGGDYSGFMGMNIYKANKLAFSLSGVDGIGFMDVCSEVYKFTDTEDSFTKNKEEDFNNFQRTLTEDEKLNAEKFKIVDLEDKFTEFNFFDKRVRRIDSKLYWDTDSDVKYFNAECGPASEFLEFSSINFTVMDPNSRLKSLIHTYSVNVAESLSTQDLQELDSILDSVEILVLNVSFTLNAENVGTPTSGKTYDYSFKSSITSDFEIESLNYSPATYILTSKEFELVVFTPAESFGGIFEANSTEEINDNKLGISLTRVEPTDQDISRGYFSEFKNEHNMVYFYGTKDGEGIGCSEDSFCGSEHINIESSKDGHPDASLKVYCFVSSEESVSYCDEFVRNLEFLDSELKIVSYPSM